MSPSSPFRCGLLSALAVAVPGQSPSLWSLVPPVRGAVPSVQQVAWLRNDIDRFVLAKLELQGLSPAPEADRATLLRRLSLDLCGLPPSAEELAAFLADPASDAYDRAVDRLLSTPQHGERMAQLWLDLARYTDTNGFDFDTDRQMWAWRDWVVRAFAADMPYDQFTMAQIAGDLLPNATLDQRIATGFHRNHAINREGEGQPGEYLHQYVADRTATFATTWLGLSVGCAQCHDHKFDPITQRDYYGLYAFWNQMPEQGLLTGSNAAPWLELPTAEQGTGSHSSAGSPNSKGRCSSRSTRGRRRWWRGGAVCTTAPALGRELPCTSVSTIWPIRRCGSKGSAPWRRSMACVVARCTSTVVMRSCSSGSRASSLPSNRSRCRPGFGSKARSGRRRAQWSANSTKPRTTAAGC